MDSDKFHTHYIGWIPTVIGALSFRSIGQATFPSRAKYANVTVALSSTASPGHTAELRRRYILAYQARNTSDAFFSRLTNAITFGGKNLYFVFWAQSESTDDLGPNTLSGQILVYRSKSSWKNFSRTPSRELIHRLHRLGLSHNEVERAEVERNFLPTMRELRDRCTFFTDVELKRNGEVHFGQVSFVDESFKAKSEKMNGGPDVLNERLANQCYFYLRDISHNHQHHAPDCDTILTLQKFEHSQPIRWKKAIVYALQYHVIDSKRRQDKSAMADALGILTYRSAFLEHVASDIIKQTPSDQHLRDSLTFRISDEKLPDREIFFFQTTLAIYALIMAALAILLQPMISGDQIRSDVSSPSGLWIVHNLPLILINYILEILIFLLFLVPIFVKTTMLPRQRKKPKSILGSIIFDIWALGQISSKSKLIIRGNIAFAILLLILGFALLAFAYLLLVDVGLFLSPFQA